MFMKATGKMTCSKESPGMSSIAAGTTSSKVPGHSRKFNTSHFDRTHPAFLDLDRSWTVFIEGGSGEPDSIEVGRT